MLIGQSIPMRSINQGDNPARSLRSSTMIFTVVILLLDILN